MGLCHRETPFPSRMGNIPVALMAPLTIPETVVLIHLHHSNEIERFDEGRTRARILGEVATGMYPGESWGAVETYVARDWQAVRGTSPLTWADVRGEAHSAWQVAKLEREGHLRDDTPVFKAA